MDMLLNGVLALVEWYHAATTATVVFDTFIFAALVVAVTHSLVKEAVGESMEEE